MREELKKLAEIPDSDVVSKVATANELASNPEIVREATKYGKVPVYYMPTRSIRRGKKDPAPGLSVLIENAMSEQEVNNLLTKGKKDYEFAQPKTIRKWEVIAKKRIGELKK